MNKGRQPQSAHKSENCMNTTNRLAREEAKAEDIIYKHVRDIV